MKINDSNINFKKTIKQRKEASNMSGSELSNREQDTSQRKLIWRGTVLGSVTPGWQITERGSAALSSCWRSLWEQEVPAAAEIHTFKRPLTSGDFPHDDSKAARQHDPSVSDQCLLSVHLWFIDFCASLISFPILLFPWNSETWVSLRSFWFVSPVTDLPHLCQIQFSANTKS